MARFGLLVGLAVAALLAAAPLSGQGGGVAEQVAAATDRPAGTLVFVFRSSRLGAIDVASGRTTTRRVPALAACGPELHASGGHVFFAGLRGGRTVVYSAPVALDRAPKRLGAAHLFVPSTTAGRVWLAGVDCSRERMVGVREVSADGRVTFAARRRVPGPWLAGTVDGGLVVQRGRVLSVWDPRVGGDGDRLPVDAALDSHGSRLIGCRGEDCRKLLILDTETGSELRVRPPSRHRLEFGAEFSPDGSLLAAPAVARRRWSVALVDTRAGTATIVPGSRTGTAYPELSWSASSGWLFFRAGSRLMAYRPGAPRAIALPFRLPRRALAFTAG